MGINPFLQPMKTVPLLFGLVLAGWIIGCTPDPRSLHIQRQLDSLEQTVSSCAKLYIIDERTLQKRLARSRGRLDTLNRLRLDATWQARITQYRGIMNVYRGFLKHYAAYEWDFQQLQKRMKALKKAWQAEKLSADSAEKQLAALQAEVQQHCEQTRQWVRRVVDVEPMYERLEPQFERLLQSVQPGRQ